MESNDLIGMTFEIPWPVAAFIEKRIADSKTKMKRNILLIAGGEAMRGGIVFRQKYINTVNSDWKVRR